MKSIIKLTIYFSTYNQEEYVAQALDSILMQKTDFRYKILAADDCSTDRTQEIILDYQKKYPEIIETYFTPVNVGGCQKLVNCIHDGLLEGDYIALLEGDDYWLNEKRLQILVDFLEKHPEYSRVGHQRKIINEVNEEMGYDIAKEVLNKPFYIEDFLEGRQYSDFGSVFRNYYRKFRDKYDSLLLSSRNVCDFQDMFITQDFGPVFVMDQCLSVYRSRSIPGATNYNSITTQKARCLENIRLAKAVEDFYKGKYDLSPMIRSNKKRLLTEAINNKDSELFAEIVNSTESSDARELIAELLYLAVRSKNKDRIQFIRNGIVNSQVRNMNFAFMKYAIQRIYKKIAGKRDNEKLRGYVRS